MAPPAKSKIKLTDANLRRLQPGRTWDAQISGFGVKVASSGKTTFILRYRGKANKQREFRIGHFGVIGVDEARKKAKVLIGKIMEGGDPQWERKLNLASATTFNEVIDKYLIWAERRHKPTSLKEVRQYCRNQIRPLFGEFECRSMRRGQIQQMYDRMKNAVTVNNKVISWSHAIWEWADQRELVSTTNPFVIQKELPVRKLPPHLS